MKKITLLGAVIGDTAGSIHEFNAMKRYDFNLFDRNMSYTDDSVMTIAIADWVLHSTSHSEAEAADSMRLWGRRYRYPMGGYGSSFQQWLDGRYSEAYNSCGNGSAMRVSACGFAFGTLDETLDMARRSAMPTHNHPEGVKGAQATAAAIFMARTGSQKEDIRTGITDMFGYDLTRTCDRIRPTYNFEGTCQKSVPESIIAFLDSRDFGDAIRLSVSLGGDADTMGAITGSIAAAFYKEADDRLVDFALSKLPADLRAVVDEFEAEMSSVD